LEGNIRLQRQQIEKLKKDNDRLKEDLALETRQAKQANDMTASTQIVKLKDQADNYRRKNDQERKKIREIDREILKLSTSIQQKKREISNANNDKKRKSTSQSIELENRRLENKLDNAHVKYNQAKDGNKLLKSQISNLRYERKNSREQFKRLDRELKEKQAIMAKVIKEGNIAAGARDDAQRQMAALKIQADKEQKQYTDEWRSLNGMITRDRNLKQDFSKSSALDFDQDPAAQERNLKSKLSKGNQGILEDEKAIQHSKQSVQEYERSFAKIIQATQIADINKLVEAFTTAEDANFSLFNYVNNLSSQIEKYQESIDEINKEIQQYQTKEADVTEDKRKALIKDLTTQQKNTEQKHANTSDNYGTAMESVTALKKGILNIFNKLGCEDSAGMLGYNGVTESNMLQYLSKVEEKTVELLEIYAEKHASESKQAAAASKKSDKPRAQPIAEENDEKVAAPAPTPAAAKTTEVSDESAPAAAPAEKQKEPEKASA